MGACKVSYEHSMDDRLSMRARKAYPRPFRTQEHRGKYAKFTLVMF